MHKDAITSYFASLTFPKELLNTRVAAYLNNFRFPLLLLMFIVAVGLVAYAQIPRRLNPEISLPIVTVTTVLPGASPDSIERLISKPLEDKLMGMDKLDTITSTSTENVSVVILNFLSTVDPQKAKDEVKALVDEVELPAEAQTPLVRKVDFEQDPVWIFTIASSVAEPSLYAFAKNLETKLKNLAVIDTVDLKGYPKEEIHVTVDQNKIRTLNITPFTLQQAINTATKTFPGGVVTKGDYNFALSLDEQVVGIDDVRNTRIGVNGTTVRLGDIAAVTYANTKDFSRTFVQKNGQAMPGVTFYVYKTSSSNIDAAVKDAQKVVEAEVGQKEHAFTLVDVLNTAHEIDEQFTELAREFAITIALVFINLLVFLGFRQALIASFVIPLTLLTSFAVIQAFGLSLNFLTLFAFLLSLGLLVDDAIVAVSAMTAYARTKKFTPLETGLLVWRDFLIPIWTTTITNVWAFLPLLLATGIIGEFIKSIPIVVSSALISSTFIATLITIPLMMFAQRPFVPQRVKTFLKALVFIAINVLFIVLAPKGVLFFPIMFVYLLLVFVIWVNRATFTSYLYEHRIRIQKSPRVKAIKNLLDHGMVNVEALSLRYKALLENILSSTAKRRMVIAMIVVFGIFAFALVPLGLVKQEFFPKTDENLIYVNALYPRGITLEKLNESAPRLMQELTKTPHVQTVIADVGTAFTMTGGGGFTGSTNGILYTLTLSDVSKRKETSIEIAEKLRDTFADYKEAEIQVIEISGGPPAGADVQLSILGDEFKELSVYAAAVMDYLKKQEGVLNVDVSVKPGTSKIVFEPNKDAMREEGVSMQEVGTAMRTYASGLTLGSVTVNNTDVDIVFTHSPGKATVEGLENIYVVGSRNEQIPLSMLGKFTLKESPTVIEREDGKRVLTVTASVAKGYNVPEINKKLLDYTKTLTLKEGYTFKTGGVNEENQKSVQSILMAMGLSFILILTTMVLQFKSFRQALIVLLVVPIAACGVFIVFGLLGTPLSFPALIGVLALFGIVVKTAIIVVEKINQNRHFGMRLKDAVTDAAQSRMEPVLLTSATTIIGLLPITIADPLWRGLGGAIIAGLLFAGIIKLFFVPVMYYNWFRDGEE